MLDAGWSSSYSLLSRPCLPCAHRSYEWCRYSWSGHEISKWRHRSDRSVTPCCLWLWSTCWSVWIWWNAHQRQSKQSLCHLFSRQWEHTESHQSFLSTTIFRSLWVRNESLYRRNQTQRQFAHLQRWCTTFIHRRGSYWEVFPDRTTSQFMKRDDW